MKVTIDWASSASPSRLTFLVLGRLKKGAFQSDEFPLETTLEDVSNVVHAFLLAAAETKKRDEVES